MKVGRWVRRFGEAGFIERLEAGAAELVTFAACFQHPDSGGCPAGDAEEPALHRVVFANRAGVLQEHQERGLKRIVGGVAIAERLIAHAEDHRAMALEQGAEGGFRGVSFVVQKPLEQVAIGEADGAAGGEENLNLFSQSYRGRSLLHGSGSPMAGRCDTLIVSPAPGDRFKIPGKCSLFRGEYVLRQFSG